MVTALIPGSFNPPTKGHLDIISRCADVFENVRVVVIKNTAKVQTFTSDECAEMLRIITKDMPNVSVDTAEGLVVDYAKKIGAGVIVKGLRNARDLDFEIQMAEANNLMTGIETMLIASRGDNIHISSSLVREIASLGGDISKFVPPEICKIITDKFKK
ncbi:MAG: pantetheine-phosphate adenylyltransferase [Bacillota bacterium]|nr:pantetheine-phosphate adenylyltransferase [Bacillota bacterium]